MTAIGIDLGTTNSLIAVFEGEEPRLIPNRYGEMLTPSVVSLVEGELEVGKSAKARLVSHPAESVALFKRGMGTEQDYRLGKRSFRAEELSAMVLRSLKEDAEADLGQPVKDVVVSVPAYFNELQRKAVRNACRLAELNATRLINEPTAAALAYGLHERGSENTFIVYDLGGGTFDVSVMEFFEGVMEVRATSGDAFIGGEDFTLDLAKALANDLPDRKLDDEDRAALVKVAEQAKLALTTEQSTDINAVIGSDSLTTTLNREKFEQVNTENLKRLRRPVELALYDAEIDADELDRVVLVGGATRMPVIRSLIAKQLRKLPEAKHDPDHVVALGAATQAALVMKNEALKDVVMTDVSAFTLGIETSKMIGKSYESGFFQPIIERNSVVPISREETFYTLEKGQAHIDFNIYQGEAPFVRSNIKLGQIKLSVPRNLENFEAVRVRFTYDVSGLLEVDCEVLSTGKVASAVIRGLAGDMSDAEVTDRLDKLKGLKVHPRDQAATKLIMARLEQCYAMSRQQDREIIGDLLARFKAEVEGQDNAAIEKLSAEIEDILNQFEGGYAR